jgi:hypothetical protein
MLQPLVATTTIEISLNGQKGLILSFNQLKFEN